MRLPFRGLPQNRRGKRTSPADKYKGGRGNAVWNKTENAVGYLVDIDGRQGI
ncbi:MAG: hypothetical protein ACLRSW_03710 [Christensenellaceae bacterium]